MTTNELHEILDDENRKLTADELKEVVYQLKQDSYDGYAAGYEQGVRDFAKRIRERDRTWSISEIEKELLGEKNDKRDTV